MNELGSADEITADPQPRLEGGRNQHDSSGQKKGKVHKIIASEQLYVNKREIDGYGRTGRRSDKGKRNGGRY